jgi:hypothetical protein
MSDNKNPGSVPPLVSAEDLRKALLETEMKKADEARRLRDAKQKEVEKFTQDFLGQHVTEDEIAMVRRLVQLAVENGKFEAMVYTFPSDLCSDSGRAINSADPDWPSTLQGKAKEFFERYQQFGKPQGFKLKAMIINFPGGVPGDVGFFLNWAPDHV